MGESFKNEKTIREYLLGRVSDETTREGVEELLFTDEEFCSQVELAEDVLINDYVFELLDEADASSFRATLAADPERLFKLRLTQALREKALAQNAKVPEDKPSFFASLEAFFSQPKYVATLAVLLIAVLVSAVYFGTKDHPDELAELRLIYRQERPTETRLSEFAYAPFAQLRGAQEPAETNRLRRIENSLIDATERTPNAQTLHSLGVFYLTQQKYTDAIKEFERALKFAEQNAQIHNDLGAAYFELAKASAKEKKLEYLANSLEEFTTATGLDSKLLGALFNRSLALQELELPRQAKESWTLYLQKDSSSRWADEARRNLHRLDNEQTLFKTDEQVLEDFLAAYRNQDNGRAQKIHNETKGLLRGAAVPLQLSRRYLMAKRRGDEAGAKECIEALNYIGSFEQAQNSDGFFSELAGFYANVGAEKIERLLQAKDILANAQHSVETDYAKAILQFENSRDLFAQLGDTAEACIAENWAVQFLPDVGRVAESRKRSAAMIATTRSRSFNVIIAPVYYWLGVSDYRQNDLSRTSRNFKTALSLAEAGGNAFEVQHAQEALAAYYSKLGELEPALAYASKMLPGKDLYYQSPSQSWREKGTLANLSLKLKFFATSLSFSKEALAIAQERWPTTIRVNQNLRNMMNATAARKDFDAAIKYAEESKRIALNRDDSAENTQTTAEIYLLLADVKSQLKDCDAALTDYDKALELYRRLPEFTFSSYQIHKGKLFCFEQLARQEDFSSELKTVLALSEEYRATIREDDSRQAFFTNEQVVFDAATANAIKARDSRGAFAFVEASRARSLLGFVKESDKTVAEVEKEFASVARPLSLEEIQTRLPEQLQLVQYSVLPDRLAIWVVSKTRFDLIEKPITAAELENKIGAYQNSVIGKGTELGVRQGGKELYELLIPPNIASDKQICLIPDKSLHQLVFASLVSPAGKYLLEDYALFYAPSASVMVLATENARRKEQIENESLMSIGNPDFDREENPHLADLQDAVAEAKAVAGGYRKAIELLGGKATKENFLRNFAGVEVIHFAGHFVANRQSPGNSKLLFAGDELRSSELGAYKLPKAKLVVLSACETGFERYDKSEGAIGIARAFLALGAPLVVASQWKVDSEPTKDLMIAFHRNRKEKQLTSAESLRRAQLEMLGNERTKAPFYWAAFSLFGGYANY